MSYKTSASCSEDRGFLRMQISDLSKMLNRNEAVIEEHQILGCKHPAIGGIPDDYRDAEGYPRFAKEASEIARKFSEAGMRFSYHNHSFEFEKYGDRTGLEILRDDSDPSVFNMEIDSLAACIIMEPLMLLKRLKNPAILTSIILF